MQKIQRTTAALAGGAAIGLFAAPADAGGFAIEQQNAKAMGSAFAGAQARRADPGFAAYNPAAIAGVEGLEFSGNVTGIWPVSSYEGAQGSLLSAAPIAGSASGEGFGGDAVVPNVSIGAPLGSRAAIGLVVHAPYGLKTEYDANSVLRYQAQESEAKSIALSPIIAFELTDTLSIGGSLRIQYFDLSVSAAIDAAGIAAASMIPGFIPGTDDVAATFDGDDVAIGFTAGFLWRASPALTIGGSYASRITHDIEGEAAFDIAQSLAGQTLNGAAGLFAPTRFSSDFNTPALAGLGLSYDLTDRLTLLASTTYTRWSVFENVVLNFDNPAQPPEILTQNWDNGWSVSIGGDYEISAATTLRAGMMYDSTPVNDAFASPRIPDADRYWVTAGASQAFNDKFSADVSVAVAFFEDRPIALDGASPEAFFRGALAATLETTVIAASLRLRYAF